ncbi:zinc finger protein 675-like [Rhagoletis pomonella]|uniref:zinc finger protein 675-like n=1 Tax=Rhagoletis pomonella TaxID=28610 RepID=UPI001781C846|nr:zinc finger protein 675-like [Rhagoletis pomonella]
MNEILIFGRCRICLEEKRCRGFLLGSLETEHAQVAIKTNQKQLVTFCSAGMLTCSECATETNIRSKATDIFMQNEETIVSEDDSDLHDLNEYVGEEVEYILPIKSEQFSKVASSNCHDISIANELTIYKRGAGRPPKRYDTLFQCDLCCYVTAYAKYFRTHMSDAHREEQARIFKCPQCTESYVEARCLREHIKHFHECIPRKPKLLCAECGKGFSKQSHLRRHSYVHNPNEKPFLCEYCPMRFASQSTLTRHIDGAHKKNKPHACELCGKAFGHIYGLKAHKQKVHAKEAQ